MVTRIKGTDVRRGTRGGPVHTPGPVRILPAFLVVLAVPAACQEGGSSELDSVGLSVIQRFGLLVEYGQLRLCLRA